MTQVTNPTAPTSSVPNAQGGLDIQGTATDDRLNAGSGNDNIQTRGGNDIIFANAGNDTARGGKGNDFLDGGAGNDVLFGDLGNDTIAGGSGDDAIYGDNPSSRSPVGGNDVLSGGDGNDLIFGQAGNDVINGDAGNDTLWGGKGADTVNGGAGNDFISGDTGNDLLTGGAGSDTFYFASIGGNGDLDTITDFAPGEDKIRMKQGGALAILGGTVDTSEFVVISDAAQLNLPANANKVIYNSASGLLYFNNAGNVLTVAQLTPGLTIGTSNFELF